MSAFPDMVVTMDSLETTGGAIRYHWTLTGYQHRTGRHRPAGAYQRLRGMDLSGPMG
jgi:hypothetical protein